MTKFLHEPIEKIIVKNLVHENIENFIQQCKWKLSSPEVFWVNGMIIATKKIIYGAGEKEYDLMIQGIQYFEKIIFVKFPKYDPNVLWNKGIENPRVLDYSNNNKFKELANWIESQPLWKTIPEPSQGGDTIDE